MISMPRTPDLSDMDEPDADQASRRATAILAASPPGPQTAAPQTNVDRARHIGRRGGTSHAGQLTSLVSDRLGDVIASTYRAKNTLTPLARGTQQAEHGGRGQNSWVTPGVDVEAHTALTTPTIVTKDAGGLS
jgi:hypothetical protein